MIIKLEQALLSIPEGTWRLLVVCAFIFVWAGVGLAKRSVK